MVQCVSSILISSQYHYYDEMLPMSAFIVVTHFEQFFECVINWLHCMCLCNMSDFLTLSNILLLSQLIATFVIEITILWAVKLFCAHTHTWISTDTFMSQVFWK